MKPRKLPVLVPFNKLLIFLKNGSSLKFESGKPAVAERPFTRTSAWIMCGAILSLLLCLLLFPGLPAAQQLSIIDLHFHFAKGWDIDAVVKEVDALGVAKAGNGARGAGDELALDWARRYPERFIPFAGKQAYTLSYPKGSGLGHFKPQPWLPISSNSRLR